MRFCDNDDELPNHAHDFFYESEESFYDPFWDFHVSGFDIRDDLSRKEAMNHPEVLAAMKEWKIENLGNRPIDHAVRDLLLGSMWREMKAYWFRKIVEKPAAWMVEMVSHLPIRLRRQALQLVVLRFLHVHHLLTKLSEGDLRERPGRVLERMLRCWPMGALMRFEESCSMMRYVGAEKRTARDICRERMHCPWCLARTAVEIFERYAPALPKKIAREGHYLVVLRGALTPKLLARHKQVELPFRDISTKERETIANEMDLVTRIALPELKETARRGMVSGGILIHQISPFGDRDTRPGISHQVLVLGEVVLRSEEDAEKATEHLLHGCSFINAGMYGSALQGRILPATQHFLRLLLFGSSSNYPLSSLPLISTGIEKYGRKFTCGLPGAMSLQPQFLLSRELWKESFEIMRHKKLYRPFGSWSPSALPKCRKPGSRQTKRSDRTPRLNAVNRERRRIAETRRQELLRSVQAWLTTRKEMPRRRGRPSVRCAIQHHLTEETGTRVSKRDLAWIMSNLRSTTPNLRPHPNCSEDAEI